MTVLLCAVPALSCVETTDIGGPDGMWSLVAVDGVGVGTLTRSRRVTPRTRNVRLLGWSGAEQKPTVMRQVIASSIARRTYAMVPLIAFACLAVLLCALGIYGVVRYVAHQRT